MTSEEKERMIHIRINNDLHKELRKAAAEYDLTMQDIVSEAVEKRIQSLEGVEAGVELEIERLEKHARELEIRLQERLESLEVEIEEELDTEGSDEGSNSIFESSVEKRLESFGDKLEEILNRLSAIQQRLEVGE
jgi:hypothetical protein